MDLSVDLGSITLDCDGAFEGTLSFTNRAAAGDPIRLRVLHHQPPPPLQFDVNVQDVRLDHESIELIPREIHQVRVRGRLQQRCSAGQLCVQWFQTVGGVAVARTHDDLLVMIPPAPFLADESADPVVADPAGTFRYRVTLKCCRNGLPAARRSVAYELGSVDVRFARATPDAPIELDCPDGSDWIDVTGVLESPKKSGQVTVTISGGGRCKVVTRIQPNPAPDRAAHRLALAEWED
jgi:hypothetical protein